MIKFIRKRFSIKNRIILWFILAMTILLSLTLTVVWLISVDIMQKTTRSYLVSLVEENSDKLVFVEKKDYKRARKLDPNDIFIKYKGGYIQIDDDFLDIIYEVQSGLYTESGILLYGKNSIYKDTLNEDFKFSKVYKKTFENVDYFIYDRKIQVDGTDSIWIRGIVPLTQTNKQMSDIVSLVAAFLPLLLIVILICGYLASKGILRPIKKMEETAIKISEGNDMKLRIPVGEESDELSHLSLVFNKMLDRLEDLFAMEKQFTSDASHELRTPAAVITAQVDYALEKERESKEYISSLNVIKRQSRRMNHLISDMLDYTRLDKRIDEYKMKDLDFSSLLLDICSDMKPLMIHGIELNHTIEEGIGITGNNGLIVRMIQNLIDNAYKYGKENGFIHVSLNKNQEGRAILTIEDNGIGMTEEMKGKIFDRFFRGENTSQKGNGLGLSMVKKIAEIHKAEIDVQSKAGEGSTFIVTF